MIQFLENWRLALYLISAIAFIGMAWKINDWRVAASQLDQANTNLDRVISQCEIDKKTTKEAYDALEAARDRINADLTRYKRVHPATCVVPGESSDSFQSGSQHAGVHGVSSDWFRDYAAVCELYRSEVIVLSGQK